MIDKITKFKAVKNTVESLYLTYLLSLTYRNRTSFVRKYTTQSIRILCKNRDFSLAEA
jgi:hypothetical protein